jgi:phospholipase/carboxylesterase
MPRTDHTWLTYRPAEGFYTSDVETLREASVRTFLPTAYEPRYPYPLVVFFHGHGGTEEQVLRLAPRLSRRNYICISLRGPRQVGLRPDGQPGYTWGCHGQHDAWVEDYVFHSIEQTRRHFHVHSERIYLAGLCEGATFAYRLGILYPDRIGGVISLNGSMPRHGAPLFRWPDVRRLRVFIGHGIANAYVPLSMAQNDYRLLYTAGLGVALHTYPANHRLHPDMLRDVNRWLIAQCTTDPTDF